LSFARRNFGPPRNGVTAATEKSVANGLGGRVSAVAGLVILVTGGETAFESDARQL
jgi:hypothetical protein